MTGAVSMHIQVLRSLLELDRPLASVLHDLAGLPWDCEEELLILEPAHLAAILTRFKAGSLSGEDVEKWANAIEGREDVGFDPEKGEVLKEAVFDLANPALQGALTARVADHLLERLGAMMPKASS